MNPLSAISRRGLGAVLATLLVSLTIGCAGLSGAAQAKAAPGEPGYVPTVLITGANRGIGLEFASQYAERGWNVIATARKPEEAGELKALEQKYGERFRIEQLDVLDFDRVDALAVQYADTPIDILLHNAGISGGMRKQMLTKMDYAVFEQVLKVNTIAPLKISEAFLPHVQMSQEKKIITVSSSEGSIAGATQPRLYFYRTSKAGVNMVMKNLALELKRKGIAVGMVNPGMTDTDFMAGLPKRMLRPVSQAVSDMMRNIDAITVDNTAAFLEYDGSPIPF